MKVIKIRDKDYKKLEDYKIHSRQPFWEVIKMLIKKGGRKNVNRNDKSFVQD